MTAARHAPEVRHFFRSTTQGTGAKARGLRWALCAATLAATLAASLFAPVMARPGHAPTAAPLTLVVPGDFPIDDNFGHGCWVRLYDGIDFKGNELILAGPLALPRLGAVAAPWRDWDSAITGPRAVLSAYTALAFEGHAATVQPGERVADMTPRTGRRQDIESLRVDCVPR